MSNSLIFTDVYSSVLEYKVNKYIGYMYYMYINGCILIILTLNLAKRHIQLLDLICFYTFNISLNVINIKCIN